MGFLLTGGAGPDMQLELQVRPEELTFPQPSRLTVTQTLGGAFADSWGAGLQTLELVGNTGWRGSLLVNGQDAYFGLVDVVFNQWHARRKASVAAGQDPNTVKLLYNDCLNSLNKLVAPKNFTLHRSRSQPLLFRYTMSLVVLSDAAAPNSIIDRITQALQNPMKWLTGVAGLGNVLQEIQNGISTVLSVVGGITTGISTFINTGMALVNGVIGIAQQVQGEFDSTVASILTIAQNYCLAASNVFSILATAYGTYTLSALATATLMEASAQWGEAFCLLMNCFNTATTYTSLDPLLGASYCSSTAGGEPQSNYVVTNTNPWPDLLPVPSNQVTITAASQTAVNTLLGDPLLLLGQTAEVARLATVAASGVVVSPTLASASAS